MTRLNKFIAQNSNYSRRRADELIAENRVTINGQLATFGMDVESTDSVMIDNLIISETVQSTILIAFHKPKGVICSHTSQSSTPIVFDLLPEEYKQFKFIGRLDKDTSGLCLLSNNGELVNQLAHPSNNKQKTYIVTLRSPLTSSIIDKLASEGIDIGDPSKSKLIVNSYNQNIIQRSIYQPTQDNLHYNYLITITEGRNRQIRRTFLAVNNNVEDLFRISFAQYNINNLNLKAGEYKIIETQNI